MFEGMLRHVGVINNTGKNIAVVFMSLPGDEKHCLVIDTDALPDIFQEAIRKIIDSNDGQQSENLGNILGRRMSPDGSNMTLLNKFHNAGRLQKLPVDLITLTPRKGVNWPLKDVLAAMKSSNNPQESTDLSELDPDQAAVAQEQMTKFNAFANNQNALNSQDKVSKAQDLIRMAEMLEADAANRRQSAYQLAPELAPAKKSRKPVKAETENLGENPPSPVTETETLQ